MKIYIYIKLGGLRWGDIVEKVPNLTILTGLKSQSFLYQLW